MNIERERAAFEWWASDEGENPRATERVGGGYKLAQIQSYWMTWQARAALQSQVKNDRTLFCDLKTDEEKSAFFLSGRGYETGVIAQSIQNDVAMAYHRCSEYQKEMEALQAECKRLRSLIRDIKDWDCQVDGGFFSIPMPLRRRIQKAIDAAMAGGEANRPRESGHG